VERLRSQIQSLSGQGRQGGQNPGQQGQGVQQGSQGGQQPGQNGRQQGQQAGRGGQQPGQGQSGGQAGQSGQGGQSVQGGQQRGQAGQGQQQGQGGQPGGRSAPGIGGGGQQGDVGDLGNAAPRGGGGGTATWAVNTGDNRFRDGKRVVDPQMSSNPADSERVIRQGVQELNQLRGIAKSDPEVQKQIQDLIKEMQGLDPRRFPGNPEMVEQLHTQVLNDVDKLELQLSRDGDGAQAGQVRTAKAPTVPPAYQNEVAEYYRRLAQAR
jgi:hypothetical protein